MYCPFTGLGLYGGFRGNRWLKNRIKVFKQFVIPSLKAQTNQNFTVWISWRPEEKKNPHVMELVKDLGNMDLDVVHTFNGVCFWDDKFDDEKAHLKLVNNLHGTMAELLDHIGDVDEVIMTIQPSDDLYARNAVEGIQRIFDETDFEAFGYSKGYMMNYTTLEVAEYNPTTNPPFFSIKFPKATFIDPLPHMEYTGPYKSHEYIGDKLKYVTVDRRDFIVGTHGENISTVWNHPFRGDIVEDVLDKFGITMVPPLKIRFSLRKRILRWFPHRVQRKLRYVLGERFLARLYDWLRN